MSFASPTFLWFFLPVVLSLYWVSAPRRRNAVLAITSLVFYAWGGGNFVFLLVGLIALNFGAGLVLDRLKETGRDRETAVALAVALVLNLAGLITWKYAGFVTRQFNSLADAVSLPQIPVPDLLLPIGISFFTFHGISYLVDVARGQQRAMRSPMTFAAYMAMFPQLVAGPIIRYWEIADQLREPPPRRQRLDHFAVGFPRFVLGLAKKVVVADAVAAVADTGFSLGGNDLTTTTAWVAALAYTVQIYFDFSGYSDMAIGLGRMFGLTIPENFERPYSARSITEFWRRWHMSLSRWFRDYLYIPLGGNRGRTSTTYRNLIVVFFLTGLWHGANWTFVVWGAFHGLWLVVERATGTAVVAPDRRAALRRALTMLIVIVGWVLFRAVDIAHAGEVLATMFSFDGLAFAPEMTAVLTTQRTASLVLGFATLAIPATFVTGRWLEEARSRTASLARVAVSTGVAGYAGLLVAAGTFSPFLYFQF